MALTPHIEDKNRAAQIRDKQANPENWDRSRKVEEKKQEIKQQRGDK